MAPEQVIDMGRLTIETLLIMSAPLMIVALVVGLIIALFQALTSIQEMTLTFVPKILLVFIAMIMVMPWMGDVLNTFSIVCLPKLFLCTFFVVVVFFPSSGYGHSNIFKNIYTELNWTILVLMRPNETLFLYEM